MPSVQTSGAQPAPSDRRRSQAGSGFRRHKPACRRRATQAVSARASAATVYVGSPEGPTAAFGSSYRQVQEQGRACQLVDQDACFGPDVAIPFLAGGLLQVGCIAGLCSGDVVILLSSVLVGRLKDPTPYRQNQRCNRLAAIERMGVAQRVGSQLRACEAFRRQMLQHRLGLAAQPGCSGWTLFGKALEQANARGHVQHFDQFGMRAAVDRVRPKSLQPQSCCGEMNNRAVELLQCVAQGGGDAGVAEGGVEPRRSICKRTRDSAAATQQRREGRMFLTGELADARTFRSLRRARARSKGRRSRLRNEAKCLAADQALQTGRRPRNSCRRETGGQDRALERLARPSQVQRDTKTASMPSRRCNWQMATPGNSA